MANEESLSYYNEENFRNAKEKIIELITDEIEKNNKPIAYILGGQPGAGKTTIHDMLNERYNGNIISINADEYRIYHPKFNEIQQTYGNESVNYTGKFSGEMTEALIEDLSDKKYNLVVEGTLRDKNVPLKTEKLLKDKGYKTELSVMVVKPEVSYLSTILRYEQMYSIGQDPRATPKENHDRVVNAIPDNLDQIYKANAFDNITLYNRNQECLYNQNETPQLSPKKIIDDTFSMSWSMKELQNFKNDINEVTNLMTKRKASSESIKEFKSEFQNIYKDKLSQKKKELKNDLRNPDNNITEVKNNIKYISSELKKIAPDEEKQKVKIGMKL